MSKTQNKKRKGSIRGLFFFLILSGCGPSPIEKHNIHAEKLQTPLFVEVKGSGKPIVFLHGIAGSYRYWEKLVPRLTNENKTIALDLLGFGRSPWPDISYTVKDHVSAVTRTIELVSGTGPSIIVGHSMGALLALNYAISYPERVKRLILLAPPIVSSKEELKRKLAEESILHSMMAMNSFVAPLLCHLHEKLGKSAVMLYRPFLKDLPEAVIEDAALHTWNSYNKSLQHVIIDQRFEVLLKNVNVPITILVASLDKTSNEQIIKKIKDEKKIEVKEIEGEHNFLVQQNEKAISQVIGIIQNP